MKARAILFTGVDTVEVGEAELPEIAADEVLVETAYTCMSPGTELRCLSGKQDGAPPFPFIPGYSLSGRVVAVGRDVKGVGEGTQVYCGGTQRTVSPARCWGGHVSHAVVEARALHVVPGGVGLAEASAAHVLAIPYHGVRLSRALPHETVVVVGLGPIGMLSARLHGLTGARVVGVDLSPERCAVARAAGAETVTPGAEGLVASVRTLLPEGADVVVDATGAAAVFAQSVQVARTLPWGDHGRVGARVLVQGSYAGDFPVPYQAAFRNEVSILLPRDCEPSDIRSVLGLIARGKLKLGDILGAPRPVAEAPSVYGSLRQAKAGVLTAVFAWR